MTGAERGVQATGSSHQATSPAEADAAYDELIAHDRVLHRIERTYGRPDPFVWVGSDRGRSSNFAAMVLHIISQQISTAVAFVLFDRIQDALGSGLGPDGIIALGENRLHGLGLSHAKASYLVSLAEMNRSGALDIEHLDGFDDDQAIEALTAVRGIGLWTAQMFLINQLRRPDVLPAGDLGIRHAVQAGWSEPAVPTIEAVTRLGQRWAPYRTYAAALLWASLHPAGAAK
jgi:DNA-3-methyladenine glycosylase II